VLLLVSNFAVTSIQKQYLQSKCGRICVIAMKYWTPCCKYELQK